MQGEFTVGHKAPQPARVAIPQHIRPCSSRQVSASGMISQVRRNFLIFFSFRFRLHSSQTVVSTPIVEPLGGSLPSTMAVIAFQILSASGGQPGRK